MRAQIAILAAALLAACADNPGASFDQAGPDDDDVEALGPRGRFGAWYWEQPDPGGAGYQTTAGFNGTFTRVIRASVPGEGGIEWASPGQDDCAVTTWDAEDAETTGGVPGEYEEMDAGTITLSSPTWSVDLEPWDHGGNSQYYFELNPDHEVFFEEYYVVEASGEDFPAFESASDLLVPAALHMTQPPTAGYFEMADGDFEVRWDGGSLETIWIELHASEEHEFDNVQVNCNADDDGSFVIPADTVALLPRGERLVLALQQPRNTSFEVDGYLVDVGSGASAQAAGERP